MIEQVKHIRLVWYCLISQRVEFQGKGCDCDYVGPEGNLKNLQSLGRVEETGPMLLYGEVYSFSDNQAQDIELFWES